MVRPSILGGVPVFNLPWGNLSSFSLLDSLIAAGSPARPPEWLSNPTWILPSKKVPAVKTTFEA